MLNKPYVKVIGLVSIIYAYFWFASNFIDGFFLTHIITRYGAELSLTELAMWQGYNPVRVVLALAGIQAGAAAAWRYGLTRKPVRSIFYLFPCLAAGGCLVLFIIYANAMIAPLVPLYVIWAAVAGINVLLAVLLYAIPIRQQKEKDGALVRGIKALVIWIGSGLLMYLVVSFVYYRLLKMTYSAMTVESNLAFIMDIFLNPYAGATLLFGCITLGIAYGVYLTRYYAITIKPCYVFGFLCMGIMFVGWNYYLMNMLYPTARPLPMSQLVVTKKVLMAITSVVQVIIFFIGGKVMRKAIPHPIKEVVVE